MSLFDWSLESNEFNPDLNNSKTIPPINNVKLGLTCSVSEKFRNRKLLSTNKYPEYHCKHLHNIKSKSTDPQYSFISLQLMWSLAIKV